MDAWIAHVLLVAPTAYRTSAAALMWQTSGNPADASPSAFSVPVCALGGDTITHWACHTRVRASTLAAALMWQTSGNPADASPSAFSVPVCAAGDPVVVTHWACHTRVRASTLAALPQLAALIPGALWHITAHDDDSPGTARAGVADWLATQGLQLYTPPDEETT
jgi:hypothetical protein